jgi:hypothetical protein
MKFSPGITSIQITTANFKNDVNCENFCVRASFVACQRNVSNEIFNYNLAVCKYTNFVISMYVYTGTLNLLQYQRHNMPVPVRNWYQLWHILLAKQAFLVILCSESSVLTKVRRKEILSTDKHIYFKFLYIWYDILSV